MAWVQVGSRPGDILSSSLGTGPSPASFGCLVSCLSGPRLSFACLTPCTGISWCCFVDCQHGPSSHPSRPGCRGSRHLSGRRQCSILAHCSPGTLCGDSRDHLLELPQRGLGVGARGHIVLDPVDERRIGYASGVGGGVLAPAGKSSPRQRPEPKELLVFLVEAGSLTPEQSLSPCLPCRRLVWNLSERGQWSNLSAGERCRLAKSSLNREPLLQGNSVVG